MHQFSLPQQAKIVDLLAPAADAAGRTSAWYASLKNAGKVWLIAHIGQGNAATVALTALQASSVTGTGSKALTNNANIWANEDTAASDTLVAQTAAKSFTTSAALKNKVVVIEIEAEQLDHNNGFTCVGLSTGASNAANITSAIAVVLPVGYQQATPPSAVA